MKKGLRNIFIGLLVLFGISRLTGVLTFYNVPTSGSEPNLKLNSHFIGSNLISPNNLDIGYYLYDDNEFGRITVVQRLIAKSGDVLECKKGEFFVNGLNIDNSINLRRMFILNSNQYKQIDNELLNDESIVKFGNEGKFFITLDEDYVAFLSDKPKKYLADDTDQMSSNIRSKTKDWNINNFGPIQIPKNKYFFVGDNRDNSIDSRHRGFIDKKNVKGTLLLQF